MAEHGFKIVCDEGCDLSADQAAELGVTLVRASSEGRVFSPEEFRAAYALLDGEDILSLHTGARLTNSINAAKDSKPDKRVRTVDCMTMSAGLALLVRFAACLSDAGMPVDDARRRIIAAAEGIHLLMVTAPDERAIAGGAGRPKTELLAHADAFRARLIGHRRLILLRPHTAPTELLRTTDVADACGRVAQTMSRYAAETGPIAYMLVGGADDRVLRRLEKPLETNEFESARIGDSVRASALTLSLAGSGCAGVAYVSQNLVEELLMR